MATSARAYTECVDIHAEAEHICADLNRKLADDGDAARIRYVSVQANPAADDGWLVLAFWELPFPDGDNWPHDELQHYRRLLLQRFAGVARTMCVFRDPVEIQDSELRTGRPVRQLA